MQSVITLMNESGTRLTGAELTQDNLTAKQNDYAVFLPAISGFYATFVGRQRNEQYVDPARFPQGLTDMEQLNWLNSNKALFPYRWSLASGSGRCGT